MSDTEKNWSYQKNIDIPITELPVQNRENGILEVFTTMCRIRNVPL